MTQTLRLFNSKDLNKMRIQDPYRLSLSKLNDLLIYHSGYVHLDGNRYNYNGYPIAKLDHDAGYMMIELIDPVFPEHLLLPEEQADSNYQQNERQLVESLSFRIGSNCAAVFSRILEHINSINDQHIAREFYILNALQVTNSNSKEADVDCDDDIDNIAIDTMS